MKIANFVKINIASIIDYCNNMNHSEFISLCDLKYSKEMFNINFPFFIEVDSINENDKKKQSRRFWGEIYIVRGKRVRITSQWIEINKPYFRDYLEQKNIKILNYSDNISEDIKLNPIKRGSTRSNSRYRGNAIGNAQNLLIRNILSNLGKESFSEDDWISTKKYFNNKCVYCGEETELLIEHAIPINKDKLGEHRLGNIVPSCKNCNFKKANNDYKEFLKDKDEVILKIEKYMDDRDYVPLESNEQMKKILNMAYEEVAIVADRYITIINELFMSK